MVEGDRPCLLERSWLEEIGLDWREMKKRKNWHKARKKHQFRTTKTTLQQVLNNLEHVFKEEFGTLEGMEATIHVNIKYNKNMLSGQAQQPGKHHANVLSSDDRTSLDEGCVG